MAAAPAAAATPAAPYDPFAQSSNDTPLSFSDNGGASGGDLFGTAPAPAPASEPSLPPASAPPTSAAPADIGGGAINFGADQPNNVPGADLFASQPSDVPGADLFGGSGSGGSGAGAGGEISFSAPANGDNLQTPFCLHLTQACSRATLVGSLVHVNARARAAQALMFLAQTCSVVAAVVGAAVLLEDHHPLRLLLWLHRHPLSLCPAAAVAPTRAKPQGQSTSVTQVAAATSRAPTCSAAEEELRRRALTCLVAGVEPYQAIVQRLMRRQYHLRRQLRQQLRQSIPLQPQKAILQRQI